MKNLLLVASFAIATADVIKEETSTCYEKETIKTDLQHSTILNMAIDSSTNTLYFRYFQIQDAVNIRTRIAKIELDTNSFKNIEIYNAISLTVDEKKNDVYFGTLDGIYKYNHDTDKVEWIGLMGSHIETLFYKDDVLYYSESSSHYLYMYYNGTAVRYEDLEDTKVDEFLIDNEDTMFFTNTTGLFSQKKGTKDAVLINKFLNDEPKRMNMNKNGEVFVCLSNGIYKVDKQQSSLEKFIVLDGRHFIAFDKDNNFVYDNWASLYRLKPSNKSCYVVLKKCTYFEKEIIKIDVQNSIVRNMDIHSSTNTLYFYNDPDLYTHNSIIFDEEVVDSSINNLYFRHVPKYADYRGIVKFELDTNNGTILASRFIKSVTIDKKNNDIYIATPFDIYKYDVNTNKLETLRVISNNNIKTLCYKYDVLYSDSVWKVLFTYSNGTAIRYQYLKGTSVTNFCIENEDTMFFTNTTGLFSQKKGTKDAVLLKATPFAYLTKINMNRNGDVFVCLRDGIYKIDKKQSSLEKIVSLGNCSELAFDKDDNFIYYNLKSIYRLKPINETFCFV